MIFLKISLKLQSESLALHLEIYLLIEAILYRVARTPTHGSVVDLGEDAQLEHLACEVAAVELDLQDRLIEILKLGIVKT